MICPSCGHDNVPGDDACAACLTSLTHEDIAPEEARNRVEHSLMEDCVANLHPAAPISVGESTSLEEAVKIMRAKRIGCVLVTDSSGKLAGILTERDLLNKVATEIEDLSRAVVADFMTRNPDTIEPEQPLGYALQRMMVGDHRHLPVVDREGQSVGIISSRDVVHHIAALVGAD